MNKQFVPLIITKLRPPRLNQHSLERPRLMAVLEKNQDKSLTLIMGPAGFGKTTLLNQWYGVIEASDRQVSWLTLDQYDNQLDQFLAYLCASFKVLEPKISVQVEEFFELSSTLMPRMVITQLINSLAEHNTNYSLFLDDYHEITNTQVHDVIQLLVNNLPHNLNVYMGSRDVPPLCLSRLKIAGQINLIGHEVMLFSEAEIRLYFDNQNDFCLSEIQLAHIVEGTQGWPAAVQLVSLSLNETNDGSQIISSISKSAQSMTNFLAEEIFSRVSPQTRECLLALSVVDRFCQSLCDAMLENANFEQVVNSSLGTGLLQRLEDKENWYRFHPLIRAFLLKELHNHGIEQSLAIHRKAAMWFEQQGYVIEAVHHFMQSGDQSETFDLLEKYAVEMLEQGQLKLLFSLVNKLPQERIESCQKILLPLVWSKILIHDLLDVPELLAQMDEMLAHSDSQEQLQVKTEVGIIRAFSLIYIDDFVGCEAQLSQYMPLLATDQPFVKTLALNVQSLCYLNKYQFDEFYQCQQHSFKYQPQLINLGVYIYTHLLTGLAKFEQGRLTQVQAAVVAIENIPIAKSENTKEILSLGKLLQAISAYQLGEVVLANQLIDANVFAMKHYALVDLLIKLVVAKGRSLQQQGQLQQAVTFYLQLNDIAKSRQSLRLQACILHEEVRMHLNNNDQGAAKQTIQLWESLHHESAEPDIGPTAQTWEWLQLANIRLKLHCQDHNGAEQQITCLIARFARQGRVYRQLEALLLLTTLYHQQKQTEQAQKVLSDALSLDPEHAWIQPFVDEGNNLLPCYRQFLRSENSPLQLSHCQSVIKYLVLNSGNMPLKNSQEQTSHQLIDPITAKESRILNFVAQGLSNREVADQISVSVETVKSHLKSIYSKMGVNRRTQAVNLARELNLLNE